jgi:integrase
MRSTPKQSSPTETNLQSRRATIGADKNLAGVDLNTVRSWLGHVSLDTTQIYAKIDLEMKSRALVQSSMICAGNFPS